LLILLAVLVLQFIAQYPLVDGNNCAEDHFNSLTSAIEETQYILLVMGDYNAHIGKDSTKFIYHERTNNNGNHLLELNKNVNY